MNVLYILKQKGIEDMMRRNKCRNVLVSLLAMKKKTGMMMMAIMTIVAAACFYCRETFDSQFLND